MRIYGHVLCLFLLAETSDLTSEWNHTRESGTALFELLCSSLEQIGIIKRVEQHTRKWHRIFLVCTYQLLTHRYYQELRLTISLLKRTTVLAMYWALFCSYHSCRTVIFFNLARAFVSVISSVSVIYARYNKHVRWH